MIRRGRSTVLTLTLLCLAASARGQVIFQDNFTTGASPLWGNEVGSWFASGGVYDSHFPSNNPLTYSDLPFTLTDFSVDVDINNLQDGGIWLRSTDNAHRVLLVTGGNLGTGTGLYWHIANGTLSAPMNWVTGLFTPGVSNAHLHITVSGNTYSAFVNGSATPATTLTTNQFTSGHVGLYDFSGQTFDNVIVQAVVPEPGNLALLAGMGVSGAGFLIRRRKQARLIA